MALFALSDLHLSLGIDKPMDVFGPLWHDYMDRIYDNWSARVSDGDLVIIGGDVSWASYLSEAQADFEFIERLPGRKLIIKGNHDYWWESRAKLDNFILSKGFGSIGFLSNTAYIYEDFSICGTRLWQLPGTEGFKAEDGKIYERELIRLRLSMDEMTRLEAQTSDRAYTRVAVFHYPPFAREGILDERVANLLHSAGISKCIYGHLHGGGTKNASTGRIDGIDFYLTSADYLEFAPLEILN